MTFKKGDKVFVEFEVLDTCHSSDYMLVKDKSNQTRQFLKSETQVLPKKVVIPKFVAEWIEVCAGFNSIPISLSFALSPSVWEANNLSDKCTNWLYSSTNQNIFARAWLDGYEVEKEKLYYVTIPNVYHGDFGYSESHDNYSFYNKSDVTEIRFELTESEIKLEHEWAWQWAKPVEE